MQLSSQRGFTLIEVLVTVFVTAVGLLTVAGLQAMSKKVNYDAAQRTTASALSQFIIERMRANPNQLAAYVTTDATTAAAGANCAAVSALCTPQQLAAFDLHLWGQALLGAGETDAGGAATGGLVAPTACIGAAGGPNNMFTIAIVWRGVMPADPPASGESGYTTCGNGKSDYDDPDSTGDDTRMRRSMIVNAFIANPYAP